MDTPGVLARPDGERNEMEALTLASMQHLPTAVVFVMDLSGFSGAKSSIKDQVLFLLLVVVFVSPFARLAPHMQASLSTELLQYCIEV